MGFCHYKAAIFPKYSLALQQIHKALEVNNQTISKYNSELEVHIYMYLFAYLHDS